MPAAGKRAGAAREVGRWTSESAAGKAGTDVAGVVKRGHSRVTGPCWLDYAVCRVQSRNGRWCRVQGGASGVRMSDRSRGREILAYMIVIWYRDCSQAIFWSRRGGLRATFAHSVLRSSDSSSSPFSPPRIIPTFPRSPSLGSPLFLYSLSSLPKCCPNSARPAQTVTLPRSTSCSSKPPQPRLNSKVRANIHHTLTLLTTRRIFLCSFPDKLCLQTRTE